MNFTYWDYIQAFNKVLYYNNDKHKHNKFIKVCAKIFAEPISNWFINWWSNHGPTVHILPESFLRLYKEWTKVSPDLNKLYHVDHICWLESTDHIYFFIEFSIPWIHKRTPEIPKQKQLIGWELLDTNSKQINEYNQIPQKGIIDDNSVRNIARRFSFQEGDKEKMIQDYLEEVRKNLLQTITQIDKSDTSMRSETSNDDIAWENVRNQQYVVLY
ncbi:hypothetical protein H5410_061018 [Solanum commersonii]|uniref:Uncharacterized protein n=1 Tax=Solanum commersonii TaxID=4109 RepID=A0A9J5W7Q4_SOLCO|nr:hypothetical protein H5410_061018 [Solanum commersonii]